MHQRTFFPKLYVDLDDVVAQTIREFLRVLEQQFNRQVQFDDVHSFHLGHSFGLLDNELKAFMSAAHEPTVLAAIEPVPGAAETLRRLMNCAYVVIVTGRPTFTHDTTVEWLRVNAIPHHALRFLKKYVENESHDFSWREPLPLRSLRKGEFALAVEDSPKMARYFTAKLNIPVAVLDKPWNRSLNVALRYRSLCTRMSQWLEVEEWFHHVTTTLEVDREASEEERLVD